MKNMKYLTGYTLGAIVMFLIQNHQIFLASMVAFGALILSISELKIKQNVSKNKD